MRTRLFWRKLPFTAGVLCAACSLFGILLRAQNVSFQVGTVPQEVIEQRLNRMPSKEADREASLKAMFEDSGCAGSRIMEEQVNPKSPPNLICTLAGTTSARIIVAAHFDYSHEGNGAVDDWTGASLLPSLYQALKSNPRKHAIEFIEFTEKEDHLGGSRFHVKHLDKGELAAIKAVINLESLGLTTTQVWAYAANSALVGDLTRLAQAVQIPVKGVYIQYVEDDDTKPFRDAKIPAMTIHSVTQRTLYIINSRRDNLRAISVPQLYESFLLVSQYLGYIDQTLD